MSLIRADLKPVERAKNGRPKIDGEWYTRVSTFAKAIDDKSNLVNWKGRQTLIGACMAPALVAKAATTDHTDRTKMDELVERLCERAGATTGADMGDAIHAGTEAWDYGDEKVLAMLPGPVAGDVEGYGKMLESVGLTPVLAETFIANHTYKVAGTFDRLVINQHTGQYEVLDIKTSADRPAKQAAAFGALAWAMQIYLYASGKPHDADSGDLEWRELCDGVPSHAAGWVAHIQQGTGVCTPVRIDLEVGKHAADTAQAIRELRRYKGEVVDGTVG